MNDKDLARMRATQEAHMFDECVIERQTSTKNALNEAVEAFPDDSQATKCGLDMRPGSERYGNHMTTLNYDASIRLPIDTEISNLDRVRITKRYGETLTAPIEFFVVGPVQRGPSAIRLLLGKVVA